MVTLTAYSQHHAWGLSQWDKKQVKGIRLVKEELKCHYHRLHIVFTYKIQKRLYKLLDLINIISQVTGYKINVSILIVFLYTSNKQKKKEKIKTHHLQWYPKIWNPWKNATNNIQTHSLETMKHYSEKI
jgi:hypothetical protein